MHRTACGMGKRRCVTSTAIRAERRAPHTPTQPGLLAHIEASTLPSLTGIWTCAQPLAGAFISSRQKDGPYFRNCVQVTGSARFF